MNSVRSFLPLTLAAVLTLAGCDDDKKTPSLSSGNPTERLQAVRQAHDKWGATKRAKTADEEAIIGRWNHSLTNTTYLLFNADGAYKRCAALGSTSGTYRLLPNNVIEFNQQEFFAWQLQLNYRLVGDTLEIKEGIWLAFKKAAE